MNRSWIIYLFAILILPGSLFAQETRGAITHKDTSGATGKTYAIIIGISDYKEVPDLQYAHKDAQAFEEFLLSSSGGKVPREHIETFLNDKATRSNVGDAISVVARKAKPGDRVWFFFAGHGDMEDLTQIENGLLLLHNSPNGNYFGMNDDVLEILDLKRYLSPLSQRGVEMIFIVDACHAGNLTGGIEGIKQTGNALLAAWGKEYKILSCQPDQLSLESAEYGGGRGLFSLQLEEGMKGLADTDGNGVINLFELQSYIQSQVAKFSEYKQIPMVSGDLSKPFFKVDADVLAALKKQKAENFPMLAKANTKGNEDKLADSLDPAGKKLYLSFQENLQAKKLIWPQDTNALREYRAFQKRYGDHALITSMRRNLAASLNERFNEIVGPLLKGQTSYSSREECAMAAAELDSCLHLLGEQHYMYSNLKARRLFMNAMAQTWALSESEYNYAWRETVLESIRMLEESAQLEPNAAYTLSALGTHYYFVYEYEKANKAFEKFIELRPNDFSAKYSLAQMYNKLKQFDKAEAIYKTLLEKFPNDAGLQYELFTVYEQNNKVKEALAICDALAGADSSRFYGIFGKGLFHAKRYRPDSAIYYYRLSKTVYRGECLLCDNNIGHTYFVNNRPDSARFYFTNILRHDSTYVYAQFNLGTLELRENRIEEAMTHLYKAWENARSTDEGYLSSFHLYFGKNYKSDPGALQEFAAKVFTYNMQYLALASILYTYFRFPALLENTANINYLFEQLFTFKQHEATTWYQHACYLALKKDKKGALESLDKSLRGGFGSYFQLAYDNDLDLIRDSPEFTSLLRTYFPKETERK